MIRNQRLELTGYLLVTKVGSGILTSMRRIFPLWLLALCLTWQGIAFAFLGGRPLESGDAEHERMHQELRTHHHDADGTLEFDDSVASLLHMLADAGSTASLAPLETVALSSPATVVPPAPVDDIPTTAYLEGPLRPPRPTV